MTGRRHFFTSGATGRDLNVNIKETSHIIVLLFHLTLCLLIYISAVPEQCSFTFARINTYLRDD